MRKVELVETINTKPGSIISAFTDIILLKKWWGVERALIEKRKGGLYTLAWKITPTGFGYISTGLIKEYDPNSMLFVDHLIYLNPEKPFFGPMTLTIKAKPGIKNNSTEVYLCQDGYQNGPDWDWYYNIVKEAWPVVLQTLKQFLEEEENKIVPA